MTEPATLKHTQTSTPHSIFLCVNAEKEINAEITNNEHAVSVDSEKECCMSTWS